MSPSVCAARLAALLALLSVLLQAAAPASLEAPESDDTPEYWHRRRSRFYRRTAFDLPEHNLKLLGVGRLIMQDKTAQPRGHLPFWFDYQLYKKVFNKSSGSPDEEKARHATYINTCVRVWKARVLFRMLAGTADTFITSDADRFHWEIFGPVPTEAGQRDDQLAFQVGAHLDARRPDSEDPLDRAVRLVRQEMDAVESRNQVETNLRAFNELDGSAIKGRLPYR